MFRTYEQVKKNFLSGEINGCTSFFEKRGNVLEAGYCYLVEGNLSKAQDAFESIIEDDPRAHWAVSMLQMLNGNVVQDPTYFEIRNFLEIDLDIFIKHYKGDYVEQIIRYCDFLEYFNPESYKFFGRVFWANNMLPASLFFLRKARDKFYNDPELHYLMAYIAYNDNKVEQCKKSLESCLSILPTYFPALNLYKKLV